MARKTQRDWLLAGVEILATDGFTALTIERLCTALALTKGSFYHHFKDFMAYKTALLALYEHEGTLRIIDRVEHERSAAAKLRRLFELIVAENTSAETALRTWAAHDAQVRAVQARVDARRIAYVHTLCSALAVDAHQALVMAQLAYSLLVGSEQIFPPFDAPTLRRLFDEFLHLYNVA